MKSSSLQFCVRAALVGLIIGTSIFILSSLRGDSNDKVGTGPLAGNTAAPQSQEISNTTGTNFCFRDGYSEGYYRLSTATTTYRNDPLGIDLTFPPGWCIPPNKDPDLQIWKTFSCAPGFCTLSLDIRREDELLNTGCSALRTFKGGIEFRDVIPNACVVRFVGPEIGPPWEYLVLFEETKRAFSIIGNIDNPNTLPFSSIRARP